MLEESRAALLEAPAKLWRNINVFSSRPDSGPYATHGVGRTTAWRRRRRCCLRTGWRRRGDPPINAGWDEETIRGAAALRRTALSNQSFGYLPSLTAACTRFGNSCVQRSLVLIRALPDFTSTDPTNRRTSLAFSASSSRASILAWWRRVIQNLTDCMPKQLSKWLIIICRQLLSALPTTKENAEPKCVISSTKASPSFLPSGASQLGSVACRALDALSNMPSLRNPPRSRALSVFVAGRMMWAESPEASSSEVSPAPGTSPRRSCMISSIRRENNRLLVAATTATCCAEGLLQQDEDRAGTSLSSILSPISRARIVTCSGSSRQYNLKKLQEVELEIALPCAAHLFPQDRLWGRASSSIYPQIGLEAVYDNPSMLGP